MAAPLPSTETHLRTLLEERAAAICAKDAARATAAYAANTAMFILTPPLAGKAGDGLPRQSEVADWLASFQGPIQCQCRDLRITAGSEIVSAHQLLHISGTREDSQPADYWIRETLGFSHVGGRWLITRQHQSVPMYLDGSGRPALDSQP
jgi:PhnB protein